MVDKMQNPRDEHYRLTLVGYTRNFQQLTFPTSNGLRLTRSRTPLPVGKKRCTQPLEVDASNKMNLKTDNFHSELRILDIDK